MRILTNSKGAGNAIASFLKAQQDRGASPVHVVNQKTNQDEFIDELDNLISASRGS